MGTEYQSDYYNSAFGTKGSIEAGLWQAGTWYKSHWVLKRAVHSQTAATSAITKQAHSLLPGVRHGTMAGTSITLIHTPAFSAGVGFHNYQYNKNGKVKQSETILVFGGFVGASYFITPSFGLNVEAGYDITQIQGGIIKIK